MATVRSMVVFENGQHFQNGLRLLPTRVANKVVSQALRAGAKPIAAEAKRLVPVDEGKLKKSIRVRTGKTRHRGEKKIIVVTGQRLFGGEFYYGFFVHQGHRVGKRSNVIRQLQTNVHKASKSGDLHAKRRARLALAAADKRNHVKASRFMTKAFDNKRAESQSIIEQTLGMGIEREWRALMA